MSAPAVATPAAANSFHRNVNSNLIYPKSTPPSTFASDARPHSSFDEPSSNETEERQEENAEVLAELAEHYASSLKSAAPGNAVSNPGWISPSDTKDAEEEEEESRGSESDDDISDEDEEGAKETKNTGSLIFSLSAFFPPPSALKGADEGEDQCSAAAFTASFTSESSGDECEWAEAVKWVVSADRVRRSWEEEEMEKEERGNDSDDDAYVSIFSDFFPSPSAGIPAVREPPDPACLSEEPIEPPPPSGREHVEAFVLRVPGSREKEEEDDVQEVELQSEMTSKGLVTAAEEEAASAVEALRTRNDEALALARAEALKTLKEAEHAEREWLTKVRKEASERAVKDEVQWMQQAERDSETCARATARSQDTETLKRASVLASTPTASAAKAALEKAGALRERASAEKRAAAQAQAAADGQLRRARESRGQADAAAARASAAKQIAAQTEALHQRWQLTRLKQTPTRKEGGALLDSSTPSPSAEARGRASHVSSSLSLPILPRQGMVAPSYSPSPSSSSCFPPEFELGEKTFECTIALSEPLGMLVNQDGSVATVVRGGQAEALGLVRGIRVVKLGGTRVQGLQEMKLSLQAAKGNSLRTTTLGYQPPQVSALKRLKEGQAGALESTTKREFDDFR